MTAKSKSIEPKTISANGSRTSNPESRPSKMVKRATTAVALPSPCSPHIDPVQHSDPNQLKVNKSPSNGSGNDTTNDKSDEAIGDNEPKEDEKDENATEYEKEDIKENEEKMAVKSNVENTNPLDLIPDVYKTQGTMTYSSCTGYSESTCLCSSVDDGVQSALKSRVSYLERRNWITTERLGELRRKAQDAMKNHKVFTIRGCFYSIRKSLVQRGMCWNFVVSNKISGYAFFFQF